MSKFRRAAKIDSSQNEIVSALRKIPGCTVQVGHDDILVGYRLRTYWFELKEPGCVSRKTGLILGSSKKPGQKKLEAEWAGHYRIVSTLTEILTEIGITL